MNEKNNYQYICKFYVKPVQHYLVYWQLIEPKKRLIEEKNGSRWYFFKNTVLTSDIVSQQSTRYHEEKIEIRSAYGG